MFFAIDPHSETAIYQQIVNAVCADIRSGRLPYGAQLPTVRALADDLGLARGTIKRAYDELGKLGMIEMTQGRGTFVAYREDEADSRKERAMHAIDGLISTLEALSFSPAEMSIYFDLKLRQRTSRDCDVRVAVAGAPAELLSTMADQLYSLGGVNVYQYESVIPPGDGMDLTVVWAGRPMAAEWEAYAEGGNALQRAAAAPSPETIAHIARLAPGVAAAAAAVSEEYLELMRKSFRSLAPEAHVQYALAGDTGFFRLLDGASALFLPPGYEHLFPQEAVAAVSAYSAASPVYEYLYEMDGGTMLGLRDAVLRLQAQRRRGLI